MPPITVDILCNSADAVGERIPRRPERINAELKPMINR